jgi:hypothetical protein
MRCQLASSQHVHGFLGGQIQERGDGDRGLRFQQLFLLPDEFCGESSLT